MSAIENFKRAYVNRMLETLKDEDGQLAFVSKEITLPDGRKETVYKQRRMLTAAERAELGEG